MHEPLYGLVHPIPDRIAVLVRALNQFPHIRQELPGDPACFRTSDQPRHRRRDRDRIALGNAAQGVASLVCDSV